MDATAEPGGMTVAPPVTFARSPVTPGGFVKVCTVMLLFVKAAAGVKVGPDVMVKEPAKAGAEKTRKAIPAAINKELGLIVFMTQSFLE